MPDPSTPPADTTTDGDTGRDSTPSMSVEPLVPTGLLCGDKPVPDHKPEKSKTRPADDEAKSSTSPGPPAKKPRKKYVITKHRENWTDDEHQLFLDALKKYGRSWKQIEGHVRTKNVIQIRSHAQKYFIKVQKNNTGEHIPPPRPKRKQNHQNGAPSEPQMNHPVVPQNPPPVAVTLSPSMSPAMSPHPHQHAMAFALAQHPMAAHMQMPPHLYSLHALGLHAQTAQYLGYRHPMQALRPVPQSNQSQQPRFSAKAISPRLVDQKDMTNVPAHQRQRHRQKQQHRRHHQHQQHQRQHRLQLDAALGTSREESPAFAVVPMGPSSPFTQMPSDERHRFPPQASMHEDKQMKPVPVPIPKGPEPLLVPSHIDSNEHALGDGKTTSGNHQDTFLASHGQNTGEIFPLGASNAASAARAATAAAALAVAAVVGEPAAASPNFTKIYGFFAALFDPMSAPSVTNLIRGSDFSALDWEIIKLLVRNLEVNVDSVVFRQQLADTYRQQQMRQQDQQQDQD